MPRPGEQTRDAIAAAAEEFDAQVASGPRVLALAVLLTGAAAPWLGRGAVGVRVQHLHREHDRRGHRQRRRRGWLRRVVNWTQNGAVMANPVAGSVLYNSGFGCGGNCSGSSAPATQHVQPGTANGITATLYACVAIPGGSKCGTQTTTQSFAPGSHVAISPAASVVAKVHVNCFPATRAAGGASSTRQRRSSSIADQRMSKAHGRPTGTSGSARWAALSRSRGWPASSRQVTGAAQQFPAAHRAGLDKMTAGPCITAIWSFAPACVLSLPENFPEWRDSLKVPRFTPW